MPENIQLTPSQQRRIKALQQAIESSVNAKAMTASFCIDAHQFFAALIIDVKWLTMTVYHLQVFVGKRGGVTYPVWVNKEKMICRPYRNFYDACQDQEAHQWSNYI